MSQSGNNPLFSVIMPVYGVECFIADAVADVLVQSFTDFELIIVDDCTPDCSIEVVRAVAGNDERVRIVHHERNRGVSEARNTGIAEARGTWLLFLDPDDRYDCNLLECVADAIAASERDAVGIDLVIFAHDQNYFERDGKFLYQNPIVLAAGTYLRGPELGRAAFVLEKQTHLGYPWNKAYRRSVITKHHLRFESEVPLIEDLLFNVLFMHHARAITCIEDAPYHYAKRLGTNLTNEFVANYYAMHQRRIREVRDFVEESGALDAEAKSVLGSLYARFILSSIEQNSTRQSGMDHAARVKWLGDLFAESLFCELLPGARAEESLVLDIGIKLLNAHQVPALLALGHAIHLARAHSTTLYTKVKSRR